VMGRAYSQDLRERVMAAVDSGAGAYAAASIFRVSVSYIYKLLDRRKRTGETRARPWAGGSKPKLAAHDEALRARVMSEPDATLAELQAWLIAEHDLKVSIGCLWKRLRHLGLTLKKSHCAPPSKTGLMSRRRARNGVRASPISTQSALSSLMKREQKRIWCGSTAVLRAGAASKPARRMVIG
jgi:transposase